MGFSEFDDKIQVLMKRRKYCLIHYAKGTIQKDGCATYIKSITSENFKCNNATLIQLMLQTISGLQTLVGLADVDDVRYCVFVTTSQVQLPLEHMEY